MRCWCILQRMNLCAGQVPGCFFVVVVVVAVVVVFRLVKSMNKISVTMQSCVRGTGWLGVAGLSVDTDRSNWWADGWLIAV